MWLVTSLVDAGRWSRVIIVTIVSAGVEDQIRSKETAWRSYGTNAKSAILPTNCRNSR